MYSYSAILRNEKRESYQPFYNGKRKEERARDNCKRKHIPFSRPILCSFEIRG